MRHDDLWFDAGEQRLMVMDYGQAEDWHHRGAQETGAPRGQSVIDGVLSSFSVLFRWTSGTLWPAEITLFFWAMATFCTVQALQFNVVAPGNDAPNLVSTLNISVFNIGNALGAWVGGQVIDAGMGLTMVPLAVGGLALGGLLICLVTFSRPPRRPLTA